MGVTSFYENHTCGLGLYFLTCLSLNLILTVALFNFIIFNSLFIYLFIGQARGMLKFPGQGLNLCHSSDLSHSSENARSLTH